MGYAHVSSDVDDMFTDIPLSLYQPVIGSLVYCNGTTDYIEIYAYIEGTNPRVRGVASTVFTWVNGFLARSA